MEEQEGQKGTAKRRVEEWLAADAARLRTLVQLTGGNPRTTVLLVHLVLDGLAGGAREYLEQLLDQCTPNYKGRVDELPPQAQQVLDAVALNWDPVTAMELAEKTSLETNAVSTQLTRLVRQGLLEKADPGDSKKALYQVAERFFNIWYLMRASRRVRAKLRWFVEFLRVFFDSGELEQLAWERLRKYRSAGRTHSEEIETAFAYVLAWGADRTSIEDYLRLECADTELEWRPYLDLIRCPVDDELPERRVGDGFAHTSQVIEAHGLAETEAAVRKATEIEPDNTENWRDLVRVLIQRREFTEAEVSVRKAIALDPSSARSWNMLGNLLARTHERSDEAEVALRNAIKLDRKFAWPWINPSASFSQESPTDPTRPKRLFGPRSDSTRSRLGPGLTSAAFLDGYPDDGRQAKRLFERRSISMRIWLGPGPASAISLDGYPSGERRPRQLFGKRSISTQSGLGPGPNLAIFWEGRPSERRKPRRLFERPSISARSLLGPGLTLAIFSGGCPGEWGSRSGSSRKAIEPDANVTWPWAKLDCSQHLRKLGVLFVLQKCTVKERRCRTSVKLTNSTQKTLCRLQFSRPAFVDLRRKTINSRSQWRHLAQQTSGMNFSNCAGTIRLSERSSSEFAIWF